MLPLLLAALGAPGAAPFVLQVASWCSLSADGSLAAANGSTQLLVALSQMPLVCGDLAGDAAVPCVPEGPLAVLGHAVTKILRGDPAWARRLRRRRAVCRELPKRVWPPLTAPPRLRIVAERSGAALALTCHAWGFSPAEVTLRWLRDGAAVDDPPRQSRALPAGDGTFRAQATVVVTPGTGGDFVCSALHPSLEEPVSVTWAPGLSPTLSLLVSLAVLTLLLGLFLFIFGLCRYLGAGDARTTAGYSPLLGDTYAGSI
ncbi:HLA class II histocompatibility antigen, DM beta chain-like isoform X2 [Chamaea fasciata]|uniref:HLA class II histocompatibility antigen, DM beta chain-like isoform X2 n=1 Tax=Chamaea fasciata TaxID=190680 RepID=UPI00336A60AC